MKKLVSLFMILVAVFVGVDLGKAGGDKPQPKPVVEVNKDNIKTSIVGFGCFWCSQHSTEEIPEVIEAIPGYSGGDLKNPTYENHHGHIEVVRVKYDSSKLSYRQLVAKVLRMMDLRSSKGSFCDIGPAYRSALFYDSKEEKKIAEEELAKVQKILGGNVYVLIKPRKFYTRAEEYHIDYAKKNPIRYNAYRWNCRRDQTIEALWKGK